MINLDRKYNSQVFGCSSVRTKKGIFDFIPASRRAAEKPVHAMRYKGFCIKVLLVVLWNTFTSSSSALSVTPFQHSSVPKNDVGPVTAGEIIQYAAVQGTSLSVSSMGPLFRVVARASHNESIILGYCDGAIRPSGVILHLDSMKVFKPSLAKAAANDNRFKKGGGTVFGIGLLLGCLCLRHGKKKHSQWWAW